MRYTVNLDDDGDVERIHVNPKNECNTEAVKATHIRTLTLGGLVELLAEKATSIGLLSESIDAKVCEHCG